MILNFPTHFTNMEKQKYKIFYFLIFVQRNIKLCKFFIIKKFESSRNPHRLRINTSSKKKRKTISPLNISVFSYFLFHIYILILLPYPKEISFQSCVDILVSNKILTRFAENKYRDGDIHSQAIAITQIEIEGNVKSLT